MEVDAQENPGLSIWPAGGNGLGNKTQVGTSRVESAVSTFFPEPLTNRAIVPPKKLLAKVKFSRRGTCLRLGCGFRCRWFDAIARTYWSTHLQCARGRPYNAKQVASHVHWEVLNKRSLGAKTLVYPTPTWIVGSYDKQGKPNGMTAAWGGICCSDPPCIAVSLRKATYSYASLVNRQAFTISVPSQAQGKAADYFGLVSGRDTDKFAATGLTPVRSDLVDAPYVAEFPLVLECKVLHMFDLGLHTQFVGEILDACFVTPSACRQ